jgi:ABC-2 type transport system permease protein
MFIVQFIFEWKQWFRGKSFWMYAACFYLFSALAMVGASGMFGEGSVGEATIANAPYSIFSLSAFFTKLLLLVVPAVAGTTLFRERQYNIHALFFSYPIHKKVFLWAKLAAIFCLLLVLALCVLAGFVTGMIFAKNHQVEGPISWSTIGFILVAYMIPVLLAGISVVFFTVAFTKNVYHGFIIMICFWLLSETINRLSAISILQILSDPIGDNLILKPTLFLSQTEKNNLPLSFPPEYVWNRMWWFCIGGILIYAGQWYYLDKGFFAINNYQVKQKFASLDKIKTTIGLPTFSYNKISRFKLMYSIGLQEVTLILKDPVFILLNTIGGVWLVVWLMSPHPQTQMKMVPVTGIALGYPIFFYSFLVQLLTFLYAGIVLNRAKLAGISDLLATTPAPDWVFVIGKWLGLVFMQMAILLFLTLIVSAVQVVSGYPVATPIDTFISLFVIHLTGYIIWAMLAMLVQAIATNTFTGLFVLILITLAVYQLADLGFESPLLRFNAIPEPDFYFRFSDMTNYGGLLFPFLLHRFYWLFVGTMLLLLTIPLVQRERTGNAKERFRLARAKMRTKFYTKSFVFAGGSFMVLGIVIINFTQAKPLSVNINDEAHVLKDFKEDFAPFLNIKQPVITKLTAYINIIPGEFFEINGQYVLKNYHNTNIDTLLIRSSFHNETFFDWQEVATSLNSNGLVKVQVLRLNKTLLPGDTMAVRFRVVHKGNRGYEPENRVVQNGIYINSGAFPRIGWRDSNYPADSLLKSSHYQGNDEHGLLTDITIKTDPEHQAFAPGYMVFGQKSELNNIYRYITIKPIKFSFAILSGKYLEKRDSIGSAQLSIWHHPAHTYCLRNMMNGLKSSIAYHEKWFTQLEYDTINIAAFARPYGTFATLAGNCIPVSESRFLQDTNQLHQTGTDLGFYVLAHEMSHHWWGNQLQPAHAPGATMLTESLAEYVTLKVYEAQYGRNRALDFLAIQKNRYLAGRALAGKSEPELIRAGEKDDYLSYGKGALAFYMLADKWGEANLNTVLKQFLLEHAGHKPPYPTAGDLLKAIYREAPLNIHSFLHDAFESNNWNSFERHLKDYPKL